MKLCEKYDLCSRKLPDNKAGRWQQIIRALGAADLRRGSGDAERMFTKLDVNSGQPSHRFMIYVLPWDPPPPLLSSLRSHRCCCWGLWNDFTQDEGSSLEFWTPMAPRLRQQCSLHSPAGVSLQPICKSIIIIVFAPFLSSSPMLFSQRLRSKALVYLMFVLFLIR